MANEISDHASRGSRKLKKKEKGDAGIHLVSKFRTFGEFPSTQSNYQDEISSLSTLPLQETRSRTALVPVGVTAQSQHAVGAALGGPNDTGIPHS